MDNKNWQVRNDYLTITCEINKSCWDGHNYIISFKGEKYIVGPKNFTFQVGPAGVKDLIEAIGMLDISQIDSIKISSNLDKQPVLIPQDLENEGWVRKGENHYVKKDIMFRGFYRDDPMVSFMRRTWLDENEYIYRGTCPTVSDFKTICKLLGI